MQSSVASVMPGPRINTPPCPDTTMTNRTDVLEPNREILNETVTVISTPEMVLDQRNGVFVSPIRIVRRVSLPPDKIPVEGSSNPFTVMQNTAVGTLLQQHSALLKRLQKPRRQLNRDKFLDIHEQQYLHRKKLEIIQEKLHEDPQNGELLAQECLKKETYLRVLKSSLYLIRQ
ncbi:hypothetical protein Cgig2_020751 [Carnegiea gigantea]|uniref:Uncharacterized protein n=1 Tax=Carnegiea gigantea TaxID=171969 RepID=A0A9Q1JEM9_9CARY|nr:hypothetical protein Cgig2_020751 [Carnegiea gigantea]